MSKRRAQQEQLASELRALKRRRWMVACAAVLVAVAVFWQTDQWLDVHVKKIQIEGELSGAERDAVSQVIAQALKNSGAAGLHSLSLSQVQDAVAGLSWADRISARRRWPDTLVIRLVKHSVVARWGGGGFVATNGEVIERAGPVSLTAQDSDLPLLNCTQASSVRAMEVFNLLTSTLNASKQVGLELHELNESALGEWSVGFANGVSVVLGRDDVAKRLQRFLAVQQNALRTDMHKIASVDARYHNGVAVRWKAQSDMGGENELGTAEQEVVR